MLIATMVSMFVLGLITAVLSVMAWGFIRLRKLNNKVKSVADNLSSKLTESKLTEPKITKSVRDRLNKSFDITERQISLLGALDMPQSGPLHGKHKNKLVSELKALEEEKMSILKSIVDEGHDPKLVILNATTGAKETVLLSEFLSKQEALGDSASKATPPKATPTKPKLRVLTKEEMSEQ